MQELALCFIVKLLQSEGQHPIKTTPGVYPFPRERLEVSVSKLPCGVLLFLCPLARVISTKMVVHIERCGSDLRHSTRMFELYTLVFSPGMCDEMKSSITEI